MSGPRREIALSFAVVATLLCGHSILETARDALFLAGLSAERLPWVYLIIAALAFLVARRTRGLGPRQPARLLMLTMVVAAVVTVGLWGVAARAEQAFLYVLYVWTGLVATIAVGQFWLATSARFDVAQAKRAFTRIAAGGLVGAACGSAISGVLVLFLSPRDLLLAAGVFFLLTAALARALPAIGIRQPRRRSPEPAPDNGFFSHPYLLRILAVGLLTSISVTILDLVFKTVIDETVAEADLGVFFAAFYTGLNALSLIVQLAVASWLLRTLGVNRALWVLPVLAMIGAIGFLATAALIPVLLMKVVDGSLRHSLHRTSSELLYMPVSAELRARYKVGIDAISGRGGQALACLLVLGISALGGGPLALAAALLAAIAIWLTVLLGVKSHYVELFRRELRSGSIETRVAVPQLDLHSLETLISALNSPEDQVVLNAMELLCRSGRGRLIPALILYHPSPDVVIRALGHFADEERRDFLPLAGQLLRSIDPEIRAAALRAIAVVAPDGTALRGGLEDTSALVRATATVGLVSSGLAGADEADEAVRRIVREDDHAARVALVRAIASHGGRHGWDDCLGNLAAQALAGEGSPDHELSEELARAAAATRSPALLPFLIELLAARGVRMAARVALTEYGEDALDALERAASDPGTNRRVRLHIPRTIARFHTARAAEILMTLSERRPESALSYKALRGLGRLIEEAPRLQPDAARLERLVQRTAQRAIQLLAWRIALSRDPASETQGGELLSSLLLEKQVGAVERLFRLWGIANFREDFRVLYHNLVSSDARSKAQSRELFENLPLAPGLRSAILALLSEADDEIRLAGASSFYKPEPVSGPELLRTMLGDESEALSALAAHTVGELQLLELESDLAAIDVNERPLMGEVIAHARRLLVAEDVHAPR